MDKVRIGIRAEMEYDDALSWYLSISPRIADGFVESFDQALSRIAAMPEAFSLIDDTNRWYKLNRFLLRANLSD